MDFLLLFPHKLLMVSCNFSLQVSVLFLHLRSNLYPGILICQRPTAAYSVSCAMGKGKVGYDFH